MKTSSRKNLECPHLVFLSFFFFFLFLCDCRRIAQAVGQVHTPDKDATVSKDDDEEDDPFGTTRRQVRVMLKAAAAAGPEDAANVIQTSATDNVREKKHLKREFFIFLISPFPSFCWCFLSFFFFSKCQRLFADISKGLPEGAELHYLLVGSRAICATAATIPWPGRKKK